MQWLYSPIDGRGGGEGHASGADAPGPPSHSLCDAIVQCTKTYGLTLHVLLNYDSTFHLQLCSRTPTDFKQLHEVSSR